jgi:PAS domain S-box-containing protein
MTNHPSGQPEVPSNLPAGFSGSAADHFFRMCSDLLCVIGYDGYFIDLNPAWEDTLGYTRDELKSRHYSTFLHPDDVGPTQSEFEEELSGKDVFAFVNRYICKDGSVKWLEWRGKASPDRKMAYASAHDVTAILEAQRVVKQGEKRFKTLILNIGEGFALLNQDEICLMANPTAERIFGEETLVGKSLDAFLAEDTKAMIREETRKRKAGYSSRYDLEIHLRDGTKKEILVTATPLTESGKFVGTLGVFRDITEQRQQELLIRRQNEELQKMNREKDTYFSILAHDLRSPLGAFLNLTHLMEKEFSQLSRELLFEYSRILSVSAGNLYSMLENLLEWSRMQRGLLTGQIMPLALLPEVRTVVSQHALIAGRKRVALTHDIPADLIIRADENMLRTILRNLVSNALKYTPSGGKVEVVAAVGADGKEATISVTDTGIGINPKTLETLFQFEGTAIRKGTDGEPSSGVGLVICHDFAGRMGGTIHAKSEVGKGSVFFLTLPCEPRSVPMVLPAPLHTGEEKPIAPLIILIVDDDLASKIVLIHNLQKQGHLVLSVSSGLDAVGAARENPAINLILMDIRMPGIDGYEATRQIRDFNREVVIVIQSTLSGENSLETAIQAGCNDFITKPVDMDELNDLLVRYFSEKTGD